MRLLIREMILDLRPAGQGRGAGVTIHLVGAPERVIESNRLATVATVVAVSDRTSHDPLQRTPSTASVATGISTSP